MQPHQPRHPHIAITMGHEGSPTRTELSRNCIMHLSTYSAGKEPTLRGKRVVTRALGSGNLLKGLLCWSRLANGS